MNSTGLKLNHIKHEKELEQIIRVGTIELNEKVKELERTKLAILNILEDTEQANKDLIKIREKLKAKVKELKILDKKKDELISITAHELKTPLTSIRGFVELLKNEKIFDNQTLRDKYFDIIRQDTTRLEKLISDILDLSRLDLGTLKFDFAKTSVKEIFDEFGQLCRLAVTNKNLNFITKIHSTIPEFYTDKSRLVQVLSNLVNNAIKYTNKGYIRVEALKQGDYIFFSVTDTGTGIPDKEQKRIFDRFYQVDSSYTRKVGGSGLGLAICKGIVRNLGGKIWVESQVGKGSKFIFTIKMFNKLPRKKQNLYKE